MWWNLKLLLLLVAGLLLNLAGIVPPSSTGNATILHPGNVAAASTGIAVIIHPGHHRG